MTDEQNVEKRGRTDDETFVRAWVKNAGDVRKIAEELKRKEQSVRVRGDALIKLGVNLCPAKKTRKTKEETASQLNSLIQELTQDE